MITQTATDRMVARNLGMPAEIRQLKKFSGQANAGLLRRQVFSLERDDYGGSLGTATALQQWEALADERRSWHRRILDLISPWEAELDAYIGKLSASPGGQKDIDRIAGSCVATLRSWIEVDEPELILARLENETSGIAELMPRIVDKEIRRRILSELIDRQVGCPGYSDLDLLAHIIQWEALFLRDLPPGRAQLEALSEDLILLFTERAPDGLSLSTARYFQAGRFGDRGFKREYRDDSDQVRHFAWALRIFATSSNPDRGEALLVFKETRDSLARDEPLNQADLSLNRGVRRLVGKILGREGAGEAERTPIPIQGYAAQLRLELGGS